MSVQAFVILNVTDPQTLGAYKEKAAAALAKHGGKVIAADPKPQVLESPNETPDSVALLSFPTADSAKAWREDPELAEVHALRNKGAKSTIIMLPN